MLFFLLSFASENKIIIKINIMKTFNFNNLNCSESYDVEVALSHILARFANHSR